MGCRKTYLISTGTRLEVLVREIKLFYAKGAGSARQHLVLFRAGRQHIPELIIIIDDRVNLLTARHNCQGIWDIQLKTCSRHKTPALETERAKGDKERGRDKKGRKDEIEEDLRRRSTTWGKKMIGGIEIGEERKKGRTDSDDLRRKKKL